jgi:hypothetical protein
VDRRHAQGTLDDELERLAGRARQHGIEAALSGDTEWSEHAYRWISDRPLDAVFTADDLRAELGSSPATGPVFRRASRVGLIEVIGIATSRYPQRHGGIARQWRRTAVEP